MGGSKPTMPSAPPVAEKPTSQEAIDFISRTPGAADAQQRHLSEDPSDTKEKWASRHYEATKDQPGVYWGVNKSPETTSPDWQSAATDAGWSAPSDSQSVRNVESASVSTAETEAEKRKAITERKRTGRRGTILTGSLGVTEDAAVRRKTLLGA